MHHLDQISWIYLQALLPHKIAPTTTEFSICLIVYSRNHPQTI